MMISTIIDKETAANDDFAKILGTPKRKPVYYREEDGTEYLHLQGAIAWPAMGVPGCAVIVAVTRGDEKYKVLDAAFGNYPMNCSLDA